MKGWVAMKGIRTIILAVVCGFIVFSLFGCNTDTTEKQITLEWWYRGNGQQADTALVEEALNEKLHTYEGMENVNIGLNCFPASDYFTNVTLAMSSGKQMDILNTVSYDLSTLLEDGVYIGMDDYLSDEMKSTLPDWLWAMGTYQNEIRFVPHYQRAANMNYLITPKKFSEYYDDFDKLRTALGNAQIDIKEIGTLLEEYLLAVRDAEPENTRYLRPIGKDIQYFEDFNDRLAANSIAFYNQSEQIEHYMLTEEAQELMNVTAGWYEKGYLYPDVLTVDAAATLEGANMLNAVSSIFTLNNQIGDEQTVSQAYTNMYGIDVIALPIKNEYFVPSNWAAGGDGVTISCEHPEKAVEFIELMNCEKGKELYNLVVYGIEGRHYEKIDDTHIRTFEYNTTQGGISTSYAALKWVMGNTFNAYLNQGASEIENELSLSLNESDTTLKSKLIGFYPQKTTMQTQVEQISSITQEYQDALGSGVKGKDWRSYYAEFESKLKTAGLDEIKQELQNQVNEFRKSADF